MVSKELEWFDIETKMRDLLYNQLLPVLNKSKEDREELVSTKTVCRKLEDRLHKLETMVFGERTQETVINDIYNTCAGLEGNRKKDMVKIEQECCSIHEKLVSNNFAINDLVETCKKLFNENAGLNFRIDKVNEKIENTTSTVLLEMDKVMTNFKSLSENYSGSALKIEEKTGSAIDKIATIRSEIFGLKSEIDFLQKNYYDSILSIKELKANNISAEVFAIESEENSKKFKEIQQKLMGISDEFYNRDLFASTYIPLRTACMISDYLHYSLDPKSAGYIAEYDDLLISNLQKAALSSFQVPIEDQIQKILSEVARVEDRKSKAFKSFSKKQPKSIKIPDKPHLSQEVHNLTLNPNKTQVQRTLTIESIHEEITEKTLPVLLSEIGKIKKELEGKIQEISNGLKNANEQNNIVAKQIMLEIIDSNNERHKEKAEVQRDLSKIKARVEDHKTMAFSQDETIQKITKMIVCLVENAQIQQALEAQDEEDRHLLAQNIDKDLQNELVMTKPQDQYMSSVASANFSFKKNCLSCGNTSSMLSGFRTSVVYHPTPLFYRERVYKRPELIAIKGRLIKTCWDSSQIPWKKEEIEPLFAQASKNSQLVPQIDPMRCDTDMYKELPIFTSSGVRTRKKSRLQIRSSLNGTSRF